eukprot:Nitzschia sp. Nitz4//scaffold9_size221794//20073//20761//NITZ4_001317-RA/size221794-snap-gene-0.86-mRNA-1//1//CDS//3329560914//6190//frame0
MALRLSATASTGGNSALDQLLTDASLSTSQKTDCLKTLQVVVKNLLDPAKASDSKYRTLKLDNAKLQERLFGISYIRTSVLPSVGFVEQEQVMVANEPLPVQALQQLQQAIVSATESLAKPAKLMPATEKLSEKQKARRLLEEKERKEKEIAKLERKRNVAMLQQDKLTRETDPNWKPGLSAACAKSGSSISTFRDKYGEN